ncbi:hypothetical protein AB0K60_17610 [Thermopolyspora sp. NPDC052614]|uniref:hypothetical protein n=1 Tax=Thermopolyspora sp. NPDC052614 TaxID=3155682 RepID=UPI00341D301F
MSEYRTGDTAEFGGWITMYEGVGLDPQRIHDGMAELAAQADVQAERLPEQLREDVEAILEEIEEGRGRSREVSRRLIRIRRAADPATPLAPLGRAAEALLAALGLGT